MEPFDTRTRTNIGPRKHSGVLVVGVLVLAVVAIACHVDEAGHLASIHSEPVGSLERYCVDDLSDNPPDLAEADGWIREALWDNGHGQDWESLATINQGSYGDCADMDWPQSVEVDIYYKLVDETGIACGEHSCAIPWPIELRSHHGQKDYYYYDIYLAAADLLEGGWRQDEDVEGFRRHIINHETGHAYGLADPTPEVVPDSYEDCWMAIDSDGDLIPDRNVQVYSIMHNSGWCGEAFPDHRWPTDCDLRIVQLITEEHPFVTTGGNYKGSLCGD